jgi:hypothetical protein
MIPITNEQRSNLLKLADHLMNKPLMAEFKMDTFSNNYARSYDAATDCGTAGCAIGHATYIISPKLSGEDWMDYSERLFGLSRYSDEWSWCFGSMWAAVDNSPQGAAQRIIYLLNIGEITDYFSYWKRYTKEYWETKAIA